MRRSRSAELSLTADADTILASFLRHNPPPKSEELHFLTPLMPQQRAFAADPSRLKSLLAPRRAGKTRLNNAYLFQAVLEPASVAKAWVNRGVPPIARYWAPTKDRAKEMMWRPLLRFAEEFQIPIQAKESEQIIFTENGGEIRLVGADKDKDAQKKRGDPTVLEVADEASVYGSYLEAMVEEVIGPSLDDFLGTFCLMGTPGIIWEGYWFRVSGPDESKREEGYSRHWFDSFDNTYLPHLRHEVLEKKRKKGWADENPTWLREYRGQWVKDTGAMFYAWDSKANTYKTLPELKPGERWEYVLGWDLGSPQNQALVAWAFTRHEPNLFEVYSRRGFDSARAIAAQTRALESAYGGFTFKVADAGGLGGEYIKEMGETHGVWFEFAKKSEKFAFVTEMNDEFRRGVLKTLAGSPLSDEYATLPKDPEDPTQPDERFPDHCCDAALYAWRRAKHWQFEEREELPPQGTAERQRLEAQEEERRTIARLKQRKGKHWYERRP